MLATDTEQPLEADAKADAKPHLEEHSANEPMRHIPTAPWMADKLDGDIRRRVEKLVAVIEATHDPNAENELRGLCRALDRLADAAKHIRNNGHGPNDAVQKSRWSINHAVSCLRLVDASTFGRRGPFHHFEKSKSEPLYAAFLVVLDHLNRLVPVVRALDPGIDERLCEGWVTLSEPLREQPIA
jgi:hypothetical protein